MKHFETHGIEFLYDGKPIRHQVNPTTAALIDETCRVMQALGVVKVHTLGIRNNRLMRGTSEKPENTSTHADGYWPDYQEWPDGTNGCRALDIVAVEFDGMAPLHKLDVGSDRQTMIAFCENMGWTVYHKTPLKYGDHIHIQTELKL